MRCGTTALYGSRLVTSAAGSSSKLHGFSLQIFRDSILAPAVSSIDKQRFYFTNKSMGVNGQAAYQFLYQQDHVFQSNLGDTYLLDMHGSADLLLQAI